MAENETPEPPETPDIPEEVLPEGASIPDPEKTKKGRKFSSDSPSMTEILRLKKPNTRKCVILLDSSLTHQMDEVDREISKLQREVERSRSTTLADSTQKKIDELLTQYELLEDEYEELSVEFTFQDIGRRVYDELVRENRPTEEEKKEYKDAGGEGVLPYSTESFPPLLVHKTAISPKIPLDDAKLMFEQWAEGDLETLFTTALLVCKEPTSLPKSRAGIAKIRDSRQNSTTAPNEESPTPNS
jgi:hypothetical protein